MIRPVGTEGTKSWRYDDLISTLSDRQGELERETLPLERYAQPTSLLLGDIFAHASTLTGRPDLQAAMR